MLFNFGSKKRPEPSPQPERANNWSAYEKQVDVPYSAHTGEGWGFVSDWWLRSGALTPSDVETERGNVYTAEQMIQRHFTDKILAHIASLDFDTQHAWKFDSFDVTDFGGADGFLINTIIKQLKAVGTENIHGFNVDLDTKGDNFRRLKQKQDEGEYESEIEPIQADLFSQPLPPESQHVVISRFVIQYLPREKHLEYFQTIINTLKPNGLFIFQYPSVDQGCDNQIFNKMMKDITSVISGESVNRDYPASGDFALIENEQTMVSLEFREAQVEWLCPAQDWGDRFKLSAVQLESIEKIYQKYFNQEEQMFENKQGRLSLKMVVNTYCFTKNKN